MLVSKKKLTDEEELTELFSVDPQRLDLTGRPSVVSARKWLLLKEQGKKGKKEGDFMPSYTEDLDVVLKKIKDGSGREKLVKELTTTVETLKKAIDDPKTQVEEKDVEAVVGKLETLAEEENSIDSDELKGFIGEIESAIGESVADPIELTDDEKVMVKDALTKLLPAKEKLLSSTIEDLSTLVDYTEAGEGLPQPTAQAIEKSEIPDELKSRLYAMLEKETLAKKEAELEKEKLFKSQIEKAQKEAEEAKELIEKMQTDENKREWVEKASVFKHIPLKSEELAGLLMNASKEDAEKLTNTFASVEEMLSKGKFFSEIGTTTPATEGSVEAKVDTLAKELVAKSEGKLNMVQARAEILKKDHELLRQHIDEKEN